MEKIDVPCPVCGGVVQVRKTKRGKNYYICENNPKSCNYISWNKPKLGEKWETESEETKKKTKRKRTTTKSKTKNSASKRATKKSSKTAKTKKKSN